MSKAMDVVGQTFGRWTVVDKWYSPKDNGSICRVICLCGTEKEVLFQELRNGNSKSCGCYMLDRVTTHGMTNSPEFAIWTGIKSRCHNSKDSSYYLYGGRGIRICKGWDDSFISFYQDNGSRPQSEVRLTLDRTNNDGHYSCGHCDECIKNGWPRNTRWATYKEQNDNRRPNGTAK